MVNRSDDIALGGEIFRQMRHQEPVTRVAMADDDQRIGTLSRGRIANGLTMQVNLGLAIANERLHRGDALHTGARRIPNFNRQCAVISRQCRRFFRCRVDSKDVDLTLVHQLNLAHANLMRTIGRQFRRIWALAVDAVLRVAACVGDKANRGRANRKWGDRF